MRTRIYNKMTHNEVQAYLDRGGDTIFIAIGVTEVHGNLPIDCETIGPEAYCKLLAEKVDGLAMINLPYFFPGATTIAKSTVYMSVRDGIDYLNKICHSLVDQGFKRLFFVSGHGPSYLTVESFIRDFFQETLIHPCYLMQIGKRPPMPKIDPEKGPTEEQKKQFEAFGSKTYGAYKIMDQMEYLIVDPDYDPASEPERIPVEACMTRLGQLCQEYGSYACQIYSDPSQHGGGRIFKSEEERLEVCTLGEQMMREDVENCNIVELMEVLAEYQEYAKRMGEKFPHFIKKQR